MTLLTALLATASGGVDYLYNDGWTDGGEATFQGGFVPYECFASVFVPESGDYPFTLDSVDLLFGGAGSGIQETMIFQFYEIDGTELDDPSSWRRLGEEAGAVQNSEQHMSSVAVEDFEITVPDFGGALQYYEIEEGNVAVSLCFDDYHSGYPGPANDADVGADYADRNWIYADLGASFQWRKSSDLGVNGDWILRLCVSGENIAGSCNPSAGDTDTDTDADTDTDTDTDTDADPGLLSVASVTPGSTSEGEAVDIVVLGSGFEDGADVFLGGLSVTGATVLNSQTIQGRSPSALPPGVHDLEVENADGDNAYLAGAFEVIGSTDDTCGCGAGTGSAGLAWLFGLLLPLLRRRDQR